MIPRNLLKTFVWLQACRVATGAQLLPVARSFEAHGDLPPFSLELSNDTLPCATAPRQERQRPGRSSTAFGGLMELGPCRIAPEGGYTTENPFGWNVNATVLFVDQPASVGFSRGRTITNGLGESSKLMHRFLRQFFVAFPQLTTQDFCIVGESYGGSWVPALGATIAKSQAEVENPAYFVDKQSYLEHKQVNGPTKTSNINLKGVMIGNGLIRSLFNSSTCLEWAPRAMWCEQNLKVCETKGWTSDACRKTETLCSEMGDYVTGAMGRNPYDFRRPCDKQDECYPEIPHINAYFNRPDIKSALGADEDAHFRGMSDEVLIHLRSFAVSAQSCHRLYGVESLVGVLISDMERRVATSSQMIELVGTKGGRLWQRLLLTKCFRDSGDTPAEILKTFDGWWTILRGNQVHCTNEPYEDWNRLMDEDELYEKLRTLKTTLESCKALTEFRPDLLKELSGSLLFSKLQNPFGFHLIDEQWRWSILPSRRSCAMRACFVFSPRGKETCLASFPTKSQQNHHRSTHGSTSCYVLQPA
ncbi:serine carboxypeptidase-domain-containing protein [Thelonectria olida]|uniref:Carboxypeptidase n=1 Tax=Thelonectria olida TaxID=1576542 RepID=A0A9P9AJ14_9HYPO|nr:serine carboxypeptidase-domain-containing protein [Thelonectria olida]